jgi:DNA sulfur modification protein DndE
MRPPVENVRVSAKGKDILIRIKKRTGLEHWNEICRIAYCRSLANPTMPTMNEQSGNIALDIEWRTFAGQYHQELAAITALRANRDKVDINNKDMASNYFRAHLERGIANLQNIKNLADLAIIN